MSSDRGRSNANILKTVEFGGLHMENRHIQKLLLSLMKCRLFSMEVPFSSYDGIKTRSHEMGMNPAKADTSVQRDESDGCWS